jgi:hypothetical protein
MSSLQHRAQQIRSRAHRGFAAVPRFVQGFRFGHQLQRDHDRDQGRAAAAPADNPLERYFETHVEGRGIWKWRHYFDIYHRHFARFVGTDVHILEIGVYSGGSLGMWREYFGDRCTIFGVDIEPACKAYESDSVRVFIGDQSDREFWRDFRRQAPRIDIVVDDGGHKTDQQIATLESLLPHIRPGGVYLCEDVTGLGNPFHAYVSGLAANLHGGSITRRGIVYPSQLQQLVDSVHVYPFVAVLELSPAPRTELVSARRGTEWAPFLD